MYIYIYIIYPYQLYENNPSNSVTLISRFTNHESIKCVNIDKAELVKSPINIIFDFIFQLSLYLILQYKQILLETYYIHIKVNLKVTKNKQTNKQTNKFKQMNSNSFRLEL
jgi:hypothetical protein